MNLKNHQIQDCLNYDMKIIRDDLNSILSKNTKLV